MEDDHWLPPYIVQPVFLRFILPTSSSNANVSKSRYKFHLLNPMLYTAAQAHPYASSSLSNIVLPKLSFLGFTSKFLKYVYLGEVFTPLQRMFRSPPQSMWDLTIHSPSRLSILIGTCSSLQLTWDLTIHSSLGPSVLAGTRSSLQSM